jgi:hypothetical protein
VVNPYLLRRFSQRTRVLARRRSPVLPRPSLHAPRPSPLTSRLSPSNPEPVEGLPRHTYPHSPTPPHFPFLRLLWLIPIFCGVSASVRASWLVEGPPCSLAPRSTLLAPSPLTSRLSPSNPEPVEGLPRHTYPNSHTSPHSSLLCLLWFLWFIPISCGVLASVCTSWLVEGPPCSPANCHRLTLAQRAAAG